MQFALCLHGSFRLMCWWFFISYLSHHSSWNSFHLWTHREKKRRKKRCSTHLLHAHTYESISFTLMQFSPKSPSHSYFFHSVCVSNMIWFMFQFIRVQKWWINSWLVIAHKSWCSPQLTQVMIKWEIYNFFFFDFLFEWQKPKENRRKAFRAMCSR